MYDRCDLEGAISSFEVSAGSDRLPRLTPLASARGMR